MANLRTRGVKDLVEEVLSGMPRPLTDDVTDEVLYVIENTGKYRKRYRRLCEKLTDDVVNREAGKWIKKALDAKSAKRDVPSERNTLSGHYTKLHFDRPGR